MFWIIFLLGLATFATWLGFSIKNNWDAGFGISVILGLQFTFIMLGPIGVKSKAKISEPEEVCFMQPIQLLDKAVIYFNDGSNLELTKISDINFPFVASKCIKRKIYNHYGYHKWTKYTFTIADLKCPQNKEYTVQIE